MTAASRPSSAVFVEAEVPEGWTQASICEFAVTQSGGTPSTSRRDYWDAGDQPWINSGALKDEVILRPTTFITKLGLDSSSAKLFPTKTVVIALTGATTGRVGLLNFECSTNQSVTGIFPSPVFISKYLFYFLRSARSRILDLTIGSAQPHINKQIVDAFEVPVPPLAEQKRIVEKIEQLLARVNAARERLANVRSVLKRFRQAVLAAACSGRLTVDWRASHSAVVTGLGNDLGDQAEYIDIPAGWSRSTVEDVCEAIVDCPHATPKWTTQGVICLRTTNFLAGHLDLSEVRYVSESTYRERTQRLEPREGDVLYSREGGILGLACQVPGNGRFCLGQRMMLMRANRKVLKPAFLMHVLNCPQTNGRVRELTGGSASPHLNVGEVRQFTVPLPSVPEQGEVVRRVEALFKLADAIEKRVAAATARAEKLTQAILAKAFRGELVPTEAELARRENRSYEPDQPEFLYHGE